MDLDVETKAEQKKQERTLDLKSVGGWKVDSKRRFSFSVGSVQRQLAYHISVIIFQCFCQAHTKVTRSHTGRQITKQKASFIKSRRYLKSKKYKISRPKTQKLNKVHTKSQSTNQG